jgi:Fe-S oxidoreductase
VLGLPANYAVEVIPSGCCGMAGSFGYEAEHFDLSMQIGELVLLPAVRAAPADAIIAAAGTSCRHQIKDGAARTAHHPAEILRAALVAGTTPGGIPTHRWAHEAGIGVDQEIPAHNS